MTTNAPRTIGSVETSLDLIAELKARDGATVTELAEELDKTKGTIHTHLVTLREREFVVQDGTEYRLGLKYLNFGEYVRRRVGSPEEIRNSITHLNEATGELAQFVVEEYGYAIPIDIEVSEHTISPPSGVGDREYLHSCASGKAILAFLPRDEVEEIIARHGLPQSTPQTISDSVDLFDELAQVRRQGYAVSTEERVGGLCSIAAPVHGEENVLGAVSLIGPASRFQSPRIDTVLPNQITEYANVLQLSLNDES